MGSTTLVTFLFDCPTAATTVELLGSWDNFTKPYPLKYDRRRGHGIWSGCYTFDDIICDGDLHNLGAKRTGALKMGGTYWYYYKVDDEERHNPLEPSTTLCPMLPGQRLNVLDVPTESRSRSNSESSDVFTRNPQDKYLTPVPPKPLSSPRLGDLCKETYTVSMHQFGSPRSATYPSTSQSLSPGFQRHARSASTTPQITSTALFTDFKGLKEKLAQKRAKSANVRELQIGAPTLVSTTAEEVNLIPLSALQPPSTSPVMHTPRKSPSLPPTISTKLRAFSPLGSHPVDPVKDLNLAAPVDVQQQSGRPRSRSDTPRMSTAKLPPQPTVVRANSADARRTKVFSNEPWLSSPTFPKRCELDTRGSTQTAPVLQRPSSTLEPPAANARPSSSHGGDRSSSLRKLPLDKDKELPALPRYLVPAPLFACNGEILSPTKLPEEENQEEKEDEEAAVHVISERISHFSMWSEDSVASCSPISDDDDDTVHSPTFSSLTSSSSDFGSPKRLSGHSLNSYEKQDEDHLQEEDEEEDAVPSTHLSASPPRLDELRISAFGPNLFNLDIQHVENAPRRQVSCFGLGFQSYQLPEDATSPKTTLSESTLYPEPMIKHDRGSSTSQMNRLVNDFNFLGESVH